MKKSVQIVNWVIFAVLVVFFLVSVLNLFGTRAAKAESGMALGLLFLFPIVLLIASNFIGRKHIVPSVVAFLGVMLVISDIVISVSFGANITWAWIRWLLESIALFITVSFLTWRSSGRGKSTASLS